MSPSPRKPLIYLITKGESTSRNFAEKSSQIYDIVSVAVEEEIPYVQLREKQLTTRMLFDLSQQVVRLARGTGTKILINDRADLALAAGADGVHLTSASISADFIRRTFPPDFVIGVSTHSADEVIDAAACGADFTVFGPVFETPGKGDPQGPAKVAEICQRAGAFPVIGLGGVDESNYESILTAGASGFASIRWLNDAASLRSIVRELD